MNINTRRGKFPKQALARLDIAIVFSLAAASQVTFAQETVRLYAGVAPGSEAWSLPEGDMRFPFPPFGVVRANISQPTLTIFRPKPGKANGTGVIVAPGGAFHFLALEHDGMQVVQWLTERGITAFILKYRVVQTTPEHQQNIPSESMQTNVAEQAKVFPLSVADAKRAMAYAREHASEFGLNPNRIGMIGFSSGAMLAFTTAVTSAPGEGPDFIAPFYTSIQDYMRPFSVPATAPPIFLAAATDDQLGFASHSTEVYNAWVAKVRSAELHLYAAGGHGFGILPNNTPSDLWTVAFEKWLQFKEFIPRDTR